MSKYYKAEDVIRKRAEDLADTSYWEWGNPKNVDDWIEVAEMEFKDLPTLEVEEYADKDQAYMEGYAKGVVYGGLLKSEVSEDAISREWVLSQGKYYYNGKGGQEYAIPIGTIKNAPSVVPTTEQSSKVGDCINCDTCRFEDCEPGEEPCVYCFVNDSMWEPKT